MANVSVSQSWHVLGPFGIGTREAVWGADPLEAHGGFRAMKYDPDAVFPSALGEGGVCRWTTVLASEPAAADGSARAVLRFGFSDINWSFLRSVYGWSALQYQAWARGNVTVLGNAPVALAVYSDGILELRIDGELYFGGDFYAFRRAPLILDLDPGVHTIELRLFYDIRALGGSDDPQIIAAVEFKPIPEQVNVDPANILVSDVVDGKLASPYAAVNIQNGMKEAAEITWIRPVGENQTHPSLTLLNGPFTVASHQSRPLAFKIKFPGRIPAQITFEIGYETGPDRRQRVTAVTINFEHLPISEPQKFTFLHPSGIVSYAILRPPVTSSCHAGEKKDFPVILGLHGSGVEADSDVGRHMLDDTWGFADVQAAVAAIPNWIRVMGWDGPGVMLDQWVVVGHSNGGQGSWYLLSHQPDKVLAAAPVSGYISIENYVPFSMWRNADASLAAILESSRRNFKHELLTENFAGIPILQQHGAKDDNVPAYHSRLMHQLTWEDGWMSNYHELAEAGHYFEGILTTDPLVEFYRRHTRVSRNESAERFSTIIPSSPDMGSRGGLLVDQLWSPDRYGRLDVARNQSQDFWRLETSNVRRFHIVPQGLQRLHPPKILVDGTELPFVPSGNENNITWYIQDSSGQWELTRDGGWRNLSERYGRQIGTMDAILRTKGHLAIRSHTSESDNVALQISRNLLQYFAADCELVTSVSERSRSRRTSNSGNLISVVLGSQLDQSDLDTFPISALDTRLRLRRPDGRRYVEYNFEPGLGAIFLRPLDDERVELVVWGADLDGLRQAARLVPTLTGVGQPDFVVFSTRSPWKGVGGAEAAGGDDHCLARLDLQGRTVGREFCDVSILTTLLQAEQQDTFQ
ncbi:hypothetical protein CISG_03943 [Coccidioides immitis RMSCC 3703]|uniref:Peptidase S9 prolyl oligopeptidase catalytic domain-containing protein n=1 Tax=Coccidioides immitis RMSCC 3703 TaxID=454286 RepID=A0A0J8QNP9_COCIT|nr:hypothetical protein CISG_03943 [Coccidioides immitis RMSCC 3703]